MNNNEYRVGVNRGLPVGMGYFSVSFGFGALVFKEHNLKAKAVDLALVLLGMVCLYIGSR